MLLALVTKEHAPFFQHFRLMELNPFAPGDAAALLVANAPEAHPIPPAIAEAAVSAIGGHPFYLQLLGEALVQLRRSPDRADFKAALQNLLFSRTGRLALYFENEFNRLVGRSTFLAATLLALAKGSRSATEVAGEIRAASGATANYLERLGDAVRKDEAGRYRLADGTFGLWLQWRRPGGSVVPMTVVGDEGERIVAGALAAMGFDLVYQSRASRGAFDLLGTRGSCQLGIQAKASPLPLRFSKAEWARMEAAAEKLGWDWVVAAVGAGGRVQFLDPARAKQGKEIRLPAEAAIENLLLWLDRR